MMELPCFLLFFIFNLANRFINDQFSKHVNICPEEATAEDSWEEGFKKVGQKIVHKSIVESLAVVLSYKTLKTPKIHKISIIFLYLNF